MNARFLKYVAIFPAAFLIMLWIVDHFGGGCSIVPIVIAVTVFMSTIVLFVGEASQLDLGALSSLLVGVVAFSAFGISIGVAASTSHNIKRSIHVSDIGTQIGVTTGHVLWTSTFTRHHIAQHGRHFVYAQCKVHYDYRVDGHTYKQCDYSRRPNFKTGAKVEVLYRYTNPAQARLVHMDETLPSDVHA